ncbi:MAG: sugar ABC transporter permease [Firmicutes bacterium]|jgi:multiple sugar transport system permease protein|nr:sugar ABC transporter permease [Bacillota bacterium]
MQKRPRSLKQQQARYGWAFVSLWIVGLVFFGLGPIIASGVLSFTQYDIASPPQWIGLANYTHMLHSSVFWQSLKVTTIYTVVSVPLGIIIGITLAIMLNARIRGLRFLRTAYYLPSVVSGVAVAALWGWIYNPDYGPLNAALKAIGITGPAWLESTTWVLPALIIMGLWSVGGSMVMYLAALQQVPTSLYEAAKIDGASIVRQHMSITFPMISPVIFFMLVNGIIGSFQVFTQAYVLTQGGPGYSSYFFVLYLYENAFEYFKMGYAAALAWALFLAIFLVTVLLFWSARFWVYYEDTSLWAG